MAYRGHMTGEAGVKLSTLRQLGLDNNGNRLRPLRPLPADSTSVEEKPPRLSIGHMLEAGVTSQFLRVVEAEARAARIKAAVLPTVIRFAEPDAIWAAIEGRVAKENRQRERDPYFRHEISAAEAVLLRTIRSAIQDTGDEPRYVLRVDEAIQRTRTTPEGTKTSVVSLALSGGHVSHIEKTKAAALHQLGLPAEPLQEALVLPLVELDAPYNDTKTFINQCRAHFLPEVVELSPLQILYL